MLANTREEVPGEDSIIIRKAEREKKKVESGKVLFVLE
jgi:hypothetical protein